MTAKRSHEEQGSRWVRALRASLTLCVAMIIRMRTLIVSSVLLLTAGFGAAGNAQMGPGPGGPGGPRPGRDSNMGSAASGREFVPPADFRSPSNQDWPPLGGFRGSRTPLPSVPPETAKSVPLSDVVSMVQQQFNANPESLHPNDDPEWKGGGDARSRARKREDEEHKQNGRKSYIDNAGRAQSRVADDAGIRQQPNVKQPQRKPYQQRSQALAKVTRRKRCNDD